MTKKTWQTLHVTYHGLQHTLFNTHTHPCTPAPHPNYLQTYIFVASFLHCLQETRVEQRGSVKIKVCAEDTLRVCRMIRCKQTESVNEKKSKSVGYTRTMYSQTGKNTKWAETFIWCLLSILSCIPGSFDTVTSLRMGFCRERAAASLGPWGLM